MSETTSVINVRVDAEKKKEAMRILGELGMTMSGAINTFIAQIVEKRGLPYAVRKPSRELLAAMKEADEILSGEREAKGYHDVDQMFEDILNGRES